MTHLEQECFKEGWEAYQEGAQHTGNPYFILHFQYLEYCAWENGWLRAYSEDVWHHDHFTNAHI